MFSHCLSASSITYGESKAILIPHPLCVVCFLCSPLLLWKNTETSLFHQFANSVMITLVWVYFLLLRWPLKFGCQEVYKAVFSLVTFPGLTVLQVHTLNFISAVRLSFSLSGGLASNQIPRGLMRQLECFWFDFPTSDFVTFQLLNHQWLLQRTEHTPFLLSWQSRLCVIWLNLPPKFNSCDSVN